MLPAESRYHLLEMKDTPMSTRLDHDPMRPGLKVDGMVRMDQNLDLQCGWRESAALFSAFAPRISPLPCNQGSLHCLTAGRPVNEDYGIAFILNDPARPLTIIAVADGLGGHPGGRAASYLASLGILSAAASLPTDHPQNFLQGLMEGAAYSVATFAARMPEGCCLTTAIIVLVTGDTYYLAWIGDGGARIRRHNGQWLSALEPQRGPSGLPFEVGGCLGAPLRGSWEMADVPRCAGDFLAVGTDGIMETVTDFEDFFRQPMARRHEGIEWQMALGEWLDHCLLAYPEHFTDNLTLVVLAPLDAI